MSRWERLLERVWSSRYWRLADAADTVHGWWLDLRERVADRIRPLPPPSRIQGAQVSACWFDEVDLAAYMRELPQNPDGSFKRMYVADWAEVDLNLSPREHLTVPEGTVTLRGYWAEHGIDQ